MDWNSFFMGFFIGTVIITLLIAITNNTEDVRNILRELACCKALEKCRDRSKDT